MKIRLAEKSEAKAISRFVSELAVTHIGSTLQVGGLGEPAQKYGCRFDDHANDRWIPALGRPRRRRDCRDCGG